MQGELDFKKLAEFVDMLDEKELIILKEVIFEKDNSYDSEEELHDSEYLSSGIKKDNICKVKSSGLLNNDTRYIGKVKKNIIGLFGI